MDELVCVPKEDETIRGVDLMVLNCLCRFKDCTSTRIVKETGCTITSVRESLARLGKKGLVVKGEAQFGHRAKIYNTDRSVAKSQMTRVDVCAKHYTLTGGQIQALRDMADEFERKNRMVE